MTRKDFIYREFAKGHGLQRPTKKGYITYYPVQNSSKKCRAVTYYPLNGNKTYRLVNIDIVIRNFSKIDTVIL